MIVASRSFSEANKSGSKKTRNSSISLHAISLRQLYGRLDRVQNKGDMQEVAFYLENAGCTEVNMSTDIPAPQPSCPLSAMLRPDQRGWNIDRLATYEAAKQSARFLSKKMVTSKPFKNAGALLSHSVKLALEDDKKSDLFLEFGVASGRTINLIADVAKRKVCGFDSFEGLPEDWVSGYRKGHFRGDIPDVRENVELFVGWFTDTLPGFVAKQPRDATIGFLHVDCDLYSSTVTILNYLAPLMRDGTIIVFDEYFNYVGWKQHEHKAFKEFLKTHNFCAEYFGHVPVHQQVAVKLRKKAYPL